MACFHDLIMVEMVKERVNHILDENGVLRYHSDMRLSFCHDPSSGVPAHESYKLESMVRLVDSTPRCRCYYRRIKPGELPFLSDSC